MSVSIVGHKCVRSRSIRTWVGAAGFALLLATVGRPASAQLPTGFSVSPAVGIAVAGGDFGRFLEAGPSASIRLGYELKPGLSAFAQGALDRFGSRELIHKTSFSPDIHSIRAIAGVEHELMPREVTTYDSWTARLRIGAGVAIIESDQFSQVHKTEVLTFRSVSPMATIGASLGYTLVGNVMVFVEGAFNYALVDEDKTLGLVGLAPDRVNSFNAAYSFPYSVGLRVPF